MKDLTIKKRIAFGFSTVLVLVIILAVTSMVSLRNIHKTLPMVTQDSLPGVTDMGKVYVSLAAVQLSVNSHLLATKPEEKNGLEQELQAAQQELAKQMGDYESTIHLEEDRVNFRQLKESLGLYQKTIPAVLELSRTGKADEAGVFLRNTVMPAYKAANAITGRVFKWNADYGATGAAQIERTVLRANLMAILFAVAAILLGITFACVIIVGINRVLTAVAESLKDISNQVAGAAGQVSATSQTLAEGSSEQAASLEETSASLEEITSMTRRNADNAQRANELAKQTRVAADKGVQDTQTMAAAMDAIKRSSDDIAKIIRTIDEIAFQTNILALNAAVEAARAGQSGMGFSVVADEVRNLAQRSAQAARETSGKIEGAIGNIARGVELSSQMTATLSEIVTKAREMDGLAAEVATASREQTQGVGQVNIAVGQMDKVTQSNAASAEESAASAEELNAQTITMKRTVNELVGLVGGAVAAGHVTGNQSEAPAPKSGKAAPITIRQPGRGPQKAATNGHPTATARPAETSAETAFSDF